MQSSEQNHIINLKGGLSILPALLLVVTLVTACAPQLPLPTGSLDGSETFSDSGSEPLAEKWWLAFDDATLNQLIDQSHADNLTLKIAWNRLDQARAVARKAGAGYFPTLNADGTASTTRSRTAGITTDADSYNLGLAASYEVDLWGRVRAENKAADFELLASSEDLKTAFLTITAEVATTWYQLVEQYGQRGIIQQQLKTNSQTLELIDLQFRTGKIGIADLLQQRQLVERNRGELEQAEARTSLLEHSLTILLGQQPDNLADLAPSAFAELPPLPQTGLKTELLDRRPDVKAAWYNVRAANQKTRSAIADRFPKLSLSASADTGSANAANLFDNWTTTLAANLLGPIIDGGRRRAEVDRTRAVTEEAINRYGLKVLEAITEVENALVREQHQNQYLASLESQFELAASATERIRDRYTKGAEDYQRVLASILSQQNLQRSVLTAHRELYEYRIALYRALGGSWELQRIVRTPNSAQ